MSSDRDTEGLITPDLIDESVAAMAQAQLRCLAELRQAATDMALGLETRRQQQRERDVPDLGFARIGKLVLQICAMEQRTIALWKIHQDSRRIRRTQARKQAVRQHVESAVKAVARTEAVHAEGLRRLEAALPRYDFSSPAKLAAMVADICRTIGVPFPADLFPEDGIVAAAERQVRERQSAANEAAVAGRARSDANESAAAPAKAVNAIPPPGRDAAEDEPRPRLTRMAGRGPP